MGGYSNSKYNKLLFQIKQLSPFARNAFSFALSVSCFFAGHLFMKDDFIRLNYIRTILKL